MLGGGPASDAANGWLDGDESSALVGGRLPPWSPSTSTGRPGRSRHGVRPRPSPRPPAGKARPDASLPASPKGPLGRLGLAGALGSPRCFSGPPAPIAVVIADPEGYERKAWWARPNRIRRRPDRLPGGNRWSWKTQVATHGTRGVASPCSTRLRPPWPRMAVQHHGPGPGKRHQANNGIHGYGGAGAAALRKRGPSLSGVIAFPAWRRRASSLSAAHGLLAHILGALSGCVRLAIHEPMGRERPAKKVGITGWPILFATSRVRCEIS